MSTQRSLYDNVGHVEHQHHLFHPGRFSTGVLRDADWDGPVAGCGVILHEGFGMTRDIVRITDRFAAKGARSN